MMIDWIPVINCCIFLGYPVDSKILSIWPITFSNLSTRPTVLCKTSGNFWPGTNLSDSPLLQGLSHIPLPSTFSMFSFKEAMTLFLDFWEFSIMIALPNFCFYYLNVLLVTATQIFPTFRLRLQGRRGRLLFRCGIPVGAFMMIFGEPSDSLKPFFDMYMLLGTCEIPLLENINVLFQMEIIILDRQAFYS